MYIILVRNKQASRKAERKENMENIILRAIESAIRERAYETVRQLATFMVDDYRFTPEAQDFADMVLNELEEN